MQAIGIGDLHLTDDSGKGGLAKYIENPDRYVMHEVNRCLEWAANKQITLCFFYGDICEGTRMSYEAQLAFVSLIRKWPLFMFIVILGNHDKVSKNSVDGHSLQLLQAFKIPNLKIITEVETLELQNCKVRFCPWPSTEFKVNILNVGHIEVKGSKSDSGRLMEDPEYSRSKAVICMGHLHTPHQVRNTYYSGTLYQTTFGESLPKGFHHIEWTSVDDYEIHQIPFDPLYKLHNCVVESQADVEALPNGKRDLIKLVVKDGADVVIPSSPNIVVTKVFKTKHDLVNILTEDLLNGSELVFKTSDFFKSWISQQQIPVSLKRKASKLRKDILNG